MAKFSPKLPKIPPELAWSLLMLALEKDNRRLIRKAMQIMAKHALNQKGTKK